MNTTFWSELENRLAKFNLLSHPFYKAWSCAELTRADLREYASEYWHHVSAFPTYLSALHARLEDAPLRREVLRNLMDEEGVVVHSTRPHSALWMDFANGMGAEDGDVAARTLQPQTLALIATFRQLMQHAEPAAALAALYAYESRVPQIAAEKAKGLEEHYAADARTTRYFTLHRTADVHHSQVWRDLMDAELAAHPETAGAALDAAETVAQALWCALDGVEAQRQASLVH